MQRWPFRTARRDALGLRRGLPAYITRSGRRISIAERGNLLRGVTRAESRSLTPHPDLPPQTGEGNSPPFDGGESERGWRPLPVISSEVEKSRTIANGRTHDSAHQASPTGSVRSRWRKLLDSSTPLRSARNDGCGALRVRSPVSSTGQALSLSKGVSGLQTVQASPHPRGSDGSPQPCAGLAPLWTATGKSECSNREGGRPSLP